MRIAATLLLPVLALAACRADAPASAPADSTASQPGAPQADSASVFDPSGVASHLDASARLDSAFADDPGAFVVMDAGSGVRLATSGADARRSAASTFKIPHTVRALDLGIVADTSSHLNYDTLAYPRAAWWPATWRPGMTIGQAFRASAVPVYRQIGAQIGRPRAEAGLASFGYGNRTVGPDTAGADADAYWLDGSLRVSPAEQVAFLSRLWARVHGAGTLPASPEAARAVRSFMRLDSAAVPEGGRAVLFGKTGWQNIPGDEAAWLVGVVERSGRAYPYAFVLHRDPATSSERRERTVALLRAAGVWP